MNKAVPWSIKGIDFDAREAAKEAARRDGVTLGEWMNRAIADRAAEVGANAQDFDADERLEAVAAQLARLSVEMDEDQPPRRRRGESSRRQEARRDEPRRDEMRGNHARVDAAGPDDASRDESDWDDDFSSQLESRRRPPAPAPERLRAKTLRDAYSNDFAGDFGRVRAGRDPSADAEALLEQAVAAFQDQAGRVEARTARAIANVATMFETAESGRADALAQVDARLAGLEQKLQRGARDSVRPLQGMISSVNDRLAEIEARLLTKENSAERQLARAPRPEAAAPAKTQPDEPALRQLDARLSNILAKIEKAEAIPPGEARDEQFARLERRFDALMARLDRQTVRPAPAAAGHAPAAPAHLPAAPQMPPQAAPRRALDGAISAIAARQRDLDSGAAPKIRPSAPVARAAPVAPPLAALIDERFEALARKLDHVAEKTFAPPSPPLAPPLAALLDERFEAFAKKLERAAPAPAEDKRIDRLQHGIESLSGRIEEMRREFTAGGAASRGPGDVEKALRDLNQRVEAVLSAPSSTADFDGLRAELAAMGRSLTDVAPRGAIAGLERAMRELASRVDQAQDAMSRASEASSRVSGETGAGVEKALRDLSRRVEEVLSAPSSAADFDGLRSEMASIGRSLADVAPRGAVAGLESAMRELANRVDQAQDAMLRASEASSRASGAAVEQALRDLAARVETALSSPSASAGADLAGVRSELASMGRALADVAPRGAVAGLESAVRDLSQRVDQARDAVFRAAQAQGQPTSSAEIEALARQVAAMSRALDDVAPRSQMASLENAVIALGDRIERSRGEGLRETVLGPIETLADELRRAMAEAGASANFDGVIRQLRDVEARIEDLRHAGGADRADFLKVCDQSDQLRAMIASAVEQMAPMERIERQVAGLSERLEEVARQTREAGRAQEAGRAESAAGWRGLEARLDDLASRIERVATAPEAPRAIDNSRFDDLSRRLDFVHQALAERIDVAQDEVLVRTPSSPMLEPLLRSLAEKLDTAMAPQADSRALEALERQMAQVSERLDRGDTQTGLKLERALDDLAGRLESSREAEREAARQALREAFANLPLPQRDDETAREIADLREKHEVSDRRAQQTLCAVHETLEKVVDRLAMLEDDVVEARAAQAEQMPSRAAASAGPGAAASAAARSTPRPLEFDDDRFLMEPGAGRPAERAPLADFEEAGRDRADSQELEAPVVTLSRHDEAALKAKPPQANYIDVARRALAARAAAEVAEKTEADRQQRAKGAGAATERAAAFVRPMAVADNVGARRLPALLVMAGTVLALGAFQAYRVFDSGPPPMLSVAGPHDAKSPAAQPGEQAAQPGENPAPRAPSAAANAPAPAASAPVAATPPAAPAPAAKPARGASLIDPLAVGSIGRRVNSLAGLEAAAQFRSVKELAEKGDAAAQYDMGARLAEGLGVARDPAAAIRWFEKAAAQGLAQAQYRLGAIYEKGAGATRDLRKARDYYEKSALLGNIRAMHNLAVIEAEGVEGKPDYAGAAQWFRRAADYGVRDSQFNLAILFARGMGVKQDLAQSYVWFGAAAQQGDADAAKKRDEIGGRLDAGQLAAAKRQIAEFHARPAASSANAAPLASAGPAARFTPTGGKTAASSGP